MRGRIKPQAGREFASDDSEFTLCVCELINRETNNDGREGIRSARRDRTNSNIRLSTGLDGGEDGNVREITFS